MAGKKRIPIEADLLILSFLGHFAWELLQAPLFSSFDGTDHFAGVFACLQATLGDLAIALFAFWTTMGFTGERNWVADPAARAVLVFLSTGLLVTLGIEFFSTEVLDRWSYGARMPRLPILGTGLAPMLQWLFVPMLVLWYLARLHQEGRDP